MKKYNVNAQGHLEFAVIIQIGNKKMKQATKGRFVCTWVWCKNRASGNYVWRIGIDRFPDGGKYNRSYGWRTDNGIYGTVFFSDRSGL